MFGIKGSILALRGGLTAAAVAMALLVPAGTAAAAEAMDHQIEHQDWSFAGLFGHFDKAQLQRGYKVYKEVCAGCHGMRLLSFRNLAEPGGPGFTEEAVKALAAEYEYDDLADDGSVVKRPGRPSDHFKSPFANSKEAATVNNGAVPPDLSVIAKARSVHAEMPFYMEPVKWVREIATGYQEGGPDYIHALLTSYHDEVPAGMTTAEGKPFVLADGMNFNTAFPGFQIAMPKPISDGQVEYTDGAPQTVEQYSRDVSAFLMWAAEPHLEARKALGLRVLIYLIILAALLFLAKRVIWSRVH